jgi:hypothetical protein
MSRIHSYVVRYDSGFAPNPFYGFCTLATCKPDIRRSAKIDDWVVGTGSNNRTVKRGGFLVYAMCVTESLTFQEYDSDPRFKRKKPYRTGSRKQSCGDNIYFRSRVGNRWCQRDSFHTRSDGEMNRNHVQRDTRVDRVLISDTFVYFGGSGPLVPSSLKDRDGRSLAKSGIGRSCFEGESLLIRFGKWIESLGVTGYQAPPYEWLTLR